MEIQTADPGIHANWRRLHALGLPAGSIRALLAILIFATTWGLLIFKPNQEVPDYVRDLLFIIMGHYFVARRRSGPAEEPGPPPLYLPRGTVRLFLVFGSIAVAVLLFHRGQLTALDENPGVVTLLLVGGFLLGVGVSTVSTWWRGPRQPYSQDRRGPSSVDLNGRGRDAGHPGLEPRLRSIPDRFCRRIPDAKYPSRPLRDRAYPGRGCRLLLRFEVIGARIGGGLGDGLGRKQPARPKHLPHRRFRVCAPDRSLDHDQGAGVGSMQWVNSSKPLEYLRMIMGFPKPV